MSSHVDFHYECSAKTQYGSPCLDMQNYLHPSARAYSLPQPFTGQKCCGADFGEFGQALDFKCRVRLPTAWTPERTVPHL